jgi:cyanophycin synthetase
MSSSKECVECGGAAVPHRFTYATIVIDGVLRPVFTPGPLFRTVGRGLSAIERRVTPHVLSGLVKIGVAKKQTEMDDETLLLAQVLWEEAKNRGIDMWEFRLFGLARNIFVAKLPDGRKLAFEGLPLGNDAGARVWWMDNKAELKKQFRKLGFPVAGGGEAFSEQKALKIYRTLTPPVITKPHLGSASRHTTLHIDSEEELLRAFRIAKQVSPYALVEEELVGGVYRATVVNGKFFAALRRDPPSVVGDGVSTVEELIAVANLNPARSGPYFSKLAITEAAEQELAWQGMTPDSIPDTGKRVMLHQKVNWGVGGTTADTTDGVHPDNIQLFEDVAKALKAPIAGIDFIVEDLKRSWKEQDRCGILECNSMPFFDNHHLPFEGEPRNVSAKIWEMVGA